MTIGTADQVAIHELIARYNKALDTGDYKSLVTTFTPDGEFHGVVGDFYGAQQLTDFARAYATEEQYKSFASAQHWVTNVVIDGDCDENNGTATLFAHLMMVSGDQEGGRIIFVAQYDDELVKRDGRWLFTKRHVKV